MSNSIEIINTYPDGTADTFNSEVEGDSWAHHVDACLIALQGLGYHVTKPMIVDYLLSGQSADRYTVPIV